MSTPTIETTSESLSPVKDDQINVETTSEDKIYDTPGETPIEPDTIDDDGPVCLDDDLNPGGEQHHAIFSNAVDMYRTRRFEPHTNNGANRVWSGRFTIFNEPRQSMYAAIERFLVAVEWVQNGSWNNTSAGTMTYTHSFKTSLSVTSGQEVTRGFDISASYRGMSVGYNYSMRTFRAEETTTTRTTTLEIVVPPQSMVVFYQKRYIFRDEITFIGHVPAWTEHNYYNIGPWNGHSPLTRKTATVRIDSSNYFSSAIFLPNGPVRITTTVYPPVRRAPVARQRQNATDLQRERLVRMGL